MKNKNIFRGFLCLAVVVSLTVCSIPLDSTSESSRASSYTELASPEAVSKNAFSLTDIPAYESSPYVKVNENTPYFTEAELTTECFEDYADLDALGRCGPAYACIGIETMPTEERESISQVKPSGWHNRPYSFVDGEYLYNRCHLIGFQLTGENANEKNLITGTRYMNVQGMLPFENSVGDYVASTGNHVLYRVTPVFEGSNLVCNGVLMEAYSIEDRGSGIQFCVFCYNVQPGVLIDYATGENQEDITYFLPEDTSSSNNNTTKTLYILNTNSQKFHYPECAGVENMNPDNQKELEAFREDLIAQGYSPCGTCQP